MEERRPWCRAGMDAADDLCVERSGAGDISITPSTRSSTALCRALCTVAPAWMVYSRAGAGDVTVASSSRTSMVVPGAVDVCAVIGVESQNARAWCPRVGVVRRAGCSSR
jgi:hypothetical protein